MAQCASPPPPQTGFLTAFTSLKTAAAVLLAQGLRTVGSSIIRGGKGPRGGVGGSGRDVGRQREVGDGEWVRGGEEVGEREREGTKEKFKFK